VFPWIINAPAQDLARTQDVEGGRTSIPSRELVLEVYDLAELTGHRKVEAHRAEMDSMLEGDTATVEDYRAKQEELSAAREHARRQAQAVDEVVRLYMRPKFVEDHNSSRLLDTGLLVLLASAEQHTWLQEFLKLQRESQGYLQMQTTMFTVSQGTMASLGVQGSARIYEGDAEINTLLRGLTALDEEVHYITAPKVLTRPLQTATVSILNQVAYVKDFKLEIVEPGQVEIADPVIATIQEGVLFEVRGVPLSPGIYGVEVDLTQSTLARPIPTRKILIGADRHEVTIGLPQVTTRSIQTHLTLADGSSALFVTPDDEAGRDLVLFFRLQAVEEGQWDVLETEPDPVRWR
jgi:hypothetical protein